MKEINMGKVAEYSSPNQLMLACTEKENGTTNIAPVSFVSYLSFNPPMIGFAMGKGAFTGERVQETQKVVLAMPAVGLENVVVSCGSSGGRKIDKVKEFCIDLMEVEGTSIKIPVKTKAAFIATLIQTVETGDHYLYICNIQKILGDETKEALFAWNGYAKVAPAVEK